jgi:predicted MFS family arabinose efflux permease
MLITFIVTILIMGVLTLLKPLKQPKEMPVNVQMDMARSPSVAIFGLLVVLAVAAFFVLFP